MTEATPSENQPYGIVLVTTDSKQAAETIAHTLVTEKLAACVTLLPVQSVYNWQGQVQQASEWQLVIKSTIALFPVLEARVRHLHAYEVPEIILLPIGAGSPAYLQWIDQQVSSCE